MSTLTYISQLFNANIHHTSAVIPHIYNKENQRINQTQVNMLVLFTS